MAEGGRVGLDMKALRTAAKASGAAGLGAAGQGPDQSRAGRGPRAHSRRRAAYRDGASPLRRHWHLPHPGAWIWPSAPSICTSAMKPERLRRSAAQGGRHGGRRGRDDAGLLAGAVRARAGADADAADERYVDAPASPARSSAPTRRSRRSRDHDRVLDQAHVDRLHRDQLGVVRQRVGLAARRIHPMVGARHLVDRQRIDGELVLLELDAQEVLVVLDAQGGERLLRVHAAEDARQHPVEAPQRAADERAEHDHQRRIGHEADELANGRGLRLRRLPGRAARSRCCVACCAAAAPAIPR